MLAFSNENSIRFNSSKNGIRLTMLDLKELAFHHAFLPWLTCRGITEYSMVKYHSIFTKYIMCNRSVFINSLRKILCSDFHLMSAFEKTRYIFDQSIWECNGHFDHWFSNIKDFLCGVWNLCKEELYPDDFLMNTASNSSVERRVVNGRNAMAKRP